MKTIDNDMDGKKATISTNMNLACFLENILRVMGLYDVPCDLVLERTGKFIFYEGSVQEVGIIQGDNLLIIPISEGC